MQSVALELYEQKLSDYYERSRHLIDVADPFSIYKRTRLAYFAKQLVLVRYDMVIDLLLLDKPNILWDNEDAENLYNSLANNLELKDRFDVVEYKLNSIKDDIVMVMDLTNHNHSFFLEWIIIVLIAVEVVMGVMEWFGPLLGHK
ncbi:MAG: RMD1 family protein [Thiovulaceae bacterium]|nr:RMD1 family protein [Sulfurimonadaceae bacterium]